MGRGFHGTKVVLSGDKVLGEANMMTARDLVANGDCPLCDKPAYTAASQEIIGHGVICDRCGFFRLEYDALRGFEQQRYLLSGITRLASKSGPRVETRLTLTAANMRDRAETTSGGLLGIRLNNRTVRV